MLKPHLADVICQVADGIATCYNNGRCYLPSGRCNSHDRVGCVVNGMFNGRCNNHGSIQFNLSSEVLHRTSSHMCARWNLPMFLFRDGLLTLINNASFIALLRFRSSLPTIIKFSILMLWPVVLVCSNIGEGDFWCSLNLSLQTPLRILQCIPHHSPPYYIYICRWPHSSSWLDLYLLGPPEDFWWYCLH